MQSGALPSQGITQLQPGEPIVRTLTGADTHRYDITLKEGQCASIQVEQRGIDVVIQQLAAENSVQAEAADALGRTGTEGLDIVAAQSGAYVVVVKPAWKIANGTYEIRLTERPATTKDSSMYEVRRLRTQGHQLSALDKSPQALPLIQQALALAKQTLAADDIYIAMLQRDLGDLYSDMGKGADARPPLEQALETLTTKLGPDHPQTIITKRDLASLYVVQGDYSKADLLLTETLASAQKTLGRDDPTIALILRSMAALDEERYDFVRVEDELRRALAIQEGAGLTDSSDYYQLLNNLGVFYNEQHQWAKAQPYFERALAMEEKHFGPDSPLVSKVLNNLAIDARQQKDYATAEKYYLRALAIKEKTVGPEHFDYAAVVMNLANVYASQGDYRKALDTHLRALKIFEIGLGPGEFPPIMALANVAKDYSALGDFANANQVQARLEAAVEDDIALNLEIGSDRQKLAYLDFVAQRLERAVSLNLQLEPSSSEAAAIAATALLQRKGRSLDATTDTLGALRKHSDPGDQVLLDQLKESSTQFAQVALRGPSRQQTAEQYRKSLHDLQEKKEALENLISHHSEEFRAESQPVTLAAVLAAIPADTALVEFVTYRPFNPRGQTEAETWGEPHYGVYVLHRDAPTRSMDLGPAKAIDEDVQHLREALRDPDRSDVGRLAKALAGKVLQPLEPLVSSDKRLLISPDGQLDLIPFEALIDSQGRYLIERFPITYLTAGRDLLRMQVPRNSRSAPVIVADPFFGETEGVQVASKSTPPGIAKIMARRSVTTGADASGLYFAPLSGTRAEAESIHALFPESRVLTGKSASESAVEALSGPRILHIATHGFFLDDFNHRVDTGNKAQTTDATKADNDNPLLRSGLALSGANLVKDGKGEGILTALEAANLDLWGTKLVTLSACDTGVGEVKNGQGVYGLRRSIFLAGTETLVMSLWPVSDYVTREIMTSYYRGLKRGLGRGDALRQAQLSMLKRSGRSHPFYWASFIQSGEWANLDGHR